MPSWPSVIAATVRLWVKRRTAGISKRTALVAVWVVLAVWIAIAAVDLFVLPSGDAKTPPPKPISEFQPPSALGSVQAARGQAAAWVVRQVSGAAIVACDPAMCSALQSVGLPAARLLVLQTATSDPLSSDVVVSTPAVRSEFGTRLASVYAPLVIASFGSGANRIDIRAVAPDGAVAFEAQLRTDRNARITAGKQLLRNSRVHASGAA